MTVAVFSGARFKLYLKIHKPIARSCCSVLGVRVSSSRPSMAWLQKICAYCPMPSVVSQLQTSSTVHSWTEFVTTDSAGVCVSLNTSSLSIVSVIISGIIHNVLVRNQCYSI